MIPTTNPKFDPNVIYPWQIWERYARGQTLVGVNEDDTTFASAGLTGGEKDHVLSTTELPSHSHAYSSSSHQVWGAAYGTGASEAGGAISGSGKRYASSSSDTGYTWLTTTVNVGDDQAHNNLQPYTTVYYWRRIA